MQTQSLIHIQAQFEEFFDFMKKYFVKWMGFKNYKWLPDFELVLSDKERMRDEFNTIQGWDDPNNLRGLITELENTLGHKYVSISAIMTLLNPAEYAMVSRYLIRGMKSITEDETVINLNESITKSVLITAERLIREVASNTARIPRDVDSAFWGLGIKL